MTTPARRQTEPIYRKRFDRSLIRLFLHAARISLSSPSRFLFWFRTFSMQRRKALSRQVTGSDQVMVPPLLIFSTTNRCNLQCKGCYASTLAGPQAPELPVERIETLFGEASDLGVSVIMIAGGEPLMRPEILQAAAAHPDIIFPVFTNGTLLNRYNSGIFSSHENLLPILSAEGGKYRTDNRRGPGIYNRTILNMERLHKERQLYGMSFTMTSENFDEVTHPVWMRSNHMLGARIFFLVAYVPQTQSDLHLCLTDKQKKELPERVGLLRSKIPSMFVSLPGDEERFGGCLAAGRGFLHINASGDLEPCPFAPFSDISIRDTGLREALQSRFMRTIRESHHRIGEAQGGCTLWENREWVQTQLRSNMGIPA